MNNVTLSNNKIAYLPVIDSLRAVACTMVCFCHFVISRKGFVTDTTVLKIFTIGIPGVEIFFVISGIVIPMTMFNGRYNIGKIFHFYRKRFLRIEPPYLVCAAIAIVYLYVRRFVPGTNPNIEFPILRDILLHLGYLIPFVKGAKWLDPVYWSLAVEFQYYLLISLLFPFLFSNMFFKRLFIYILLLFSGFMVESRDFLLVWLPFFVVGIAYVLYRSETIKSIEYCILTIVALIIIATHLGIIDLIVALSTISVIYFFSNARNKVFGFVGDISYSLYLIHYTVGMGFINVLCHFSENPLYKVVIVCVAYVLSIAAAWVIYKIIEKPSKDLSAKFKYN